VLILLNVGGDAKFCISTNSNTQYIFFTACDIIMPPILGSDSFLCLYISIINSPLRGLDIGNFKMINIEKDTLEKSAKRMTALRAGIF